MYKLHLSALDVKTESPTKGCAEMSLVDLKVTLDGADADNHELPAYDGFTSLAGLSLATSLITNYASTGKIRRRGEFMGRDAVKFQVPERGSVIYHFAIDLDLKGTIYLTEQANGPTRFSTGRHSNY